MFQAQIVHLLYIAIHLLFFRLKREKQVNGTTCGHIACGKCGNWKVVNDKWKMCHNDDEDKKRCRALCVDNNRTLVEVAIGPVMPKSSPNFLLEFELCQEGKCVLAAELGLFGGGEPSSVISKKGYFIRKTDVTSVLVAQGWSLEKPLTTRMTTKTRQFFAGFDFNVKKFPAPVIFVQKSGWSGSGCSENDGCKMTLNPDEDRSHYGDLLDGYPR